MSYLEQEIAVMEKRIEKCKRRIEAGYKAKCDKDDPHLQMVRLQEEIGFLLGG